MVKQPTGTNPRRYPPCTACGFKDWPASTWDDQYTYPTDGRCKNCYQEMRRRQAGMRPQAVYYASLSHPARVVGIVTLASRGIKPGTPSTDPALTAEKVWDVGNTNAHRATRWLVQHGHTGLATLATTIWEPAELTTKARAA